MISFLEFNNGEGSTELKFGVILSRWYGAPWGIFTCHVVFVVWLPLLSYIGQGSLKFEKGNIIRVNFWPRAQWGLGMILLNTLF